MENMQYAEELIREFLVFRGFTNTLQYFEKELSTDIAKGFQVDNMLNLIFSVYIPKFQAENLVGLFSFFKQCFTSPAETAFVTSLVKLEVSILRYYIVHAIQSGRKDKVVEFLAMKGNDLLLRGQDWTAWFAVPYMKNPSSDPQFRLYFSKEWYEALHLSMRNFLNEIFNGTRIPALLKLSSEKNTVDRLKKDIKQLNIKLSELQAVLEEKESLLYQLRSGSSAVGVNADQSTSSRLHGASAPQRDDEKNIVSTDPREEFASTPPHLAEIGMGDKLDIGPPAKLLPKSNPPKSDDSSSSLPNSSCTDESGKRKIVDFYSCLTSENSRYLEEGEFPEVKVGFQETFLGHTSPISRSCFSASGNNIASASKDGTVRIWTYDPSTPSSRNATIYCGAEILSLNWDCKSDRLLLIGTADGGIKAWNVDAKRVVCDLSTMEAFPNVVDLKCSPVEPIFVSAAASRGIGSNHVDKLGFASLTVWNMKTWKPVTTLPLGEDPPAITSLCFNHNGKILAASATDGMIHMFDMSAGLQITGWPAHDSAISSILFGPDETSIFSLGSDGKIFEWSLQNQGQVLWSRNCSRFFGENSLNCWKREMALDATGKRLLVTSDSGRAPIYQVRGNMDGFRTLPHDTAVTTVDWHPTLPIFLTGSADNSVRVSSME